MINIKFDNFVNIKLNYFKYLFFKNIDYFYF